MQVIVCRFRLERDVATDRGIGGFGGGGARLNINPTVHIGVDIIATNTKGIQAGAADITTPGGIGLRNTVNVDTDTVTFQATNVVSGIATTVKAAFAIAGTPACAGGANKRLVAHD